MSKYKVGDQIYVKCIVVGISDEDDPIIKLANWGNHIAVSEEEICAETYEDGLNDAWKAARKIGCRQQYGGMSSSELLEIFGDSGKSEDSKEIRRGDEVECDSDDDKMIVTYAAGNDVHAIDAMGEMYILIPTRWHKTGRNFADRLDALLSGIGNE